MDNEKLKIRDGYLTEAGRVPPHNIDAENHVIGACLIIPEAIIHCYWLQPEEFYNSENADIFRAILEVNLEGQKIDGVLVHEMLKKYNNNISYSELMLRSTQVTVIDSTKEHANIIRNTSNQRKLINICMLSLNHLYDNTLAYEEILQNIDSSFDEIRGSDRKSVISMKEALKETLHSIKNNIDGNVDILETGFTKFDNIVGLSLNSIVVYAADKGGGKSQFIATIIRNLLNVYGEELAVQWFSMEEPAHKQIKSLIADKTDLTFKQLASKGYILTELDMQKIDNEISNLENYTIDFINSKQNIDSIMLKAKNFCSKNYTKKPIIILDNLGLIGCNKNGNEKDDYIAGKIVELRDITGALIVVIHHMTKEVRSQGSEKDAFRPREEMIRGSSRIVDYANIVFLSNLPVKYEGLREEQLRKYGKGLKELEDMPDDHITEALFEKYLWSINKKGCKASEYALLLNLQQTTYHNTREVVRFIRVPFKVLVKKYKEYFDSINDLNQDRDPKYHKQIDSIYAFLKRDGWNNEYISKSKKDEYLYGYIPKDKRASIFKNLFILELTKGREGDVTGDKIIRFECNLNYNRFKECELDVEDIEF